MVPSCLCAVVPFRWQSMSQAVKELPHLCVCTSTRCWGGRLQRSPTRASSRPTGSPCSGTRKVEGVQRNLVSRVQEVQILTRFCSLCCVSASAVLVTASTEVDKTGASYYGEQTLHYLAVNGETALVQLGEYRPLLPHFYFYFVYNNIYNIYTTISCAHQRISCEKIQRK